MATNSSLYLAAVLDWFTRRVLSWLVSITLQADFCIEAVAAALARRTCSLQRYVAVNLRGCLSPATRASVR